MYYLKYPYFIFSSRHVYTCLVFLPLYSHMGYYIKNNNAQSLPHSMGNCQRVYLRLNPSVK